MKLQTLSLSKVVFTFIVMLCCSPAFTWQMNVNPRGTCEPGGLISFTFTSNAIEEATYLRIAFDKGATLCETRVWDNDANLNAATRLPINLAVSVFGSVEATPVQVIAPANSVAIVRWKAGESHIWLRIEQGFQEWLSSGVVSDDAKIRFGFGEMARDNQRFHMDSFSIGHANLPGNMRQGDDVVADTPIRFDLSASSLSWSPEQIETKTHLNYSVEAWRVSSAIGSDLPEYALAAEDIAFSNPMSVELPKDQMIAHGLFSSTGDFVDPIFAEWITGQFETILPLVNYINSIGPYVPCGGRFVP
jgi:hypothetical protein